MSKLPPCDFCKNDVPPSANRCPHCGRPGLYPNVRAAETPAERLVLDRHYQTAIRDSATRGATPAVNDFEKAIPNSKAVISRKHEEVQRLAASDRELYATFYKLLEAGVRLPEGSKWDTLRTLTDDALFQCPYLHIEDVGTMALSDEEVVRLREYLMKGGFIWADDYWGNSAWDQWAGRNSPSESRA